MILQFFKIEHISTIKINLLMVTNFFSDLYQNYNVINRNTCGTIQLTIISLYIKLKVGPTEFLVDQFKYIMEIFKVFFCVFRHFATVKKNNFQISYMYNWTSSQKILHITH